MKFLSFILTDDLLQNVIIDLFLLDLSSLYCDLIPDRDLLLSLINQHIRVFNLLPCVVSTCLSSESLLCKISNVEVPYDCIVELVPFVALPVLNKGIIMAAICMTDVHYEAFENVVEIVIRECLLLFHSLGILLFSQVLLRVLS